VSLTIALERYPATGDAATDRVLPSPADEFGRSAERSDRRVLTVRPRYADASVSDIAVG
jgi:hypothetical protein